MDEKLLERLLKGAPVLSRDRLWEINALFPAYLFRRRQTREVWASCCGAHGVLPPASELLDAAHTPEPRSVPMRCQPACVSDPPLPPPEPGTCPFCGRTAPVKELGRTGRRENLFHYRHVVVLSWRRGALWASAYEAKKSYRTEAALTAAPELKLLALYRFTPGRVEWCRRRWIDRGWSWAGEMDTRGLRPDFSLPPPFFYCGRYGMGYDLVGLEEVARSPWRWCGAEVYLRRHRGALRWLAVCTAWPRQVELLTKAGMVEAVCDFAERGKRNAAAFDWYAPDLRRGLGLSRTELRDFLAGDRSPEVLAQYRAFRRAGISASFQELYALRERTGETWSQRAAVQARRLGLGPGRLLRYLCRTREEAAQGEEGLLPLSTLAGWWCDYLDDARTLGLDLGSDLHRLPRDLGRKHRELGRAAQAVRDLTGGGEAREKDRRRMRALTKRYTYWDDSWLIRPPVGPSEIVAEGKALRHCVGGYADRHRRGVVTILFLRDRTRPGRSLVTIEMAGARLIQIHGWDDERTACGDNPERADPRELYRDFLDGWLSWLEAGSPRDRAGRPVEVRGGSDAVEPRPA